MTDLEAGVKLALFGAARTWRDHAPRWAELREEPLDGAPPLEWVGVSSAHEWERVRWQGPGRRWVVVGSERPLPPGVLASGDVAQLREPGRRPVDRLSPGWLGFAEVGLTSGRVLHDLNNVVSKAVGLVELASLSCSDPTIQERLQLAVETLLQGASHARGFWGELAVARRAQERAPFGEVSWLAAQEPLGATPARVVVSSAAREVTLPAAEAWITSAALWHLMASGSALELSIGVGSPEGVRFGKLGREERYLEVRARWTGARAEEATARLVRVTQAVRAGGRWDSEEASSSQALSLFLPAPLEPSSAP